MARTKFWHTGLQIPWLYKAHNLHVAIVRIAVQDFLRVDKGRAIVIFARDLECDASVGGGYVKVKTMGVSGASGSARANGGYMFRSVTCY